ISSSSVLPVQIQQPVWRFDHNAPRAGVHDRANLTREWNLNFIEPRRDNESVGVGRAFHVPDEANILAPAAFNVTSDQLVAVEGPGGQSNQPLSRDSHLAATRCFPA